LVELSRAWPVWDAVLIKDDAAGRDSRFKLNRGSSNPASGRHNPEFRTSRRQFLFCNTFARRKGGRHWTFPQTAGGGCTQLPGSVPRGQNSMCSATGRLVFPRELHTEPVWTEVCGRVSSTVQWGYHSPRHKSRRFESGSGRERRRPGLQLNIRYRGRRCTRHLPERRRPHNPEEQAYGRNGSRVSVGCPTPVNRIAPRHTNLDRMKKGCSHKMIPFASAVEIMHDNKVAAQHPRCYGRGV
jgi:hypothetical protein